MQKIFSGSIFLPKYSWRELGLRFRSHRSSALVNTTITLFKTSLGKMEVTSVRTYCRVAVMRLRRPLITRQTQLMYCSLSPSVISLDFFIYFVLLEPAGVPKTWCVHNSYLQFNLVQFNAFFFSSLTAVPSENQCMSSGAYEWPVLVAL